MITAAFLCLFLMGWSAAAPKEVYAASEVTLKDGVYTIAAYKNSNIVLEAAGGGTAAKTNIQLGNQKNATYQQFRITNVGGNRYKIQNVRSGKVLDVAGGSKKNGANIQQYSWNGSAAQIFTINAVNENGKYVCELVGVGSGLAVDYAGGKAQSGTNVRIYWRNHSAGQKWIFTPVASSPQGIDAGVKAGFYKIYSAKSDSLAVGIKNGLATSGLAAVMCNAGNDDGTIVKIAPTSGGRYKVTVASSGLSFSIKGNYAERKVPIVQRTATGKTCDEWYIRKASADSTEYTFVCCENPSLVMDLSGGKAVDGQSITCYPDNGSAAQKWVLRQAYDPANTHVLEDGIYCVYSAYKSNMVMEVAGSSKYKYGNIALGGRQYYTPNQLFRVEAYGTSGNAYTFTNVWSELSLDVANASTAVKANVQQYTPKQNNAQLFRIIRVVDSECPVYKIIGKGSGNAVDVAGGKLVDGSNIQMYTYIASGAQKWRFYKLTPQDLVDTLVPSSKGATTIARNTALLQEAIDQTSENGGGTLTIREGTFYFGSAGYVDKADAAIICRDNVTIEGAGMDKTILKPYGTFTNGMNMFFHGGETEFITNADFRNFTIDSSEEKAQKYNNQGKGFMLSPLKDCDWENVRVMNTDGTGFGVDQPVNCTIRNCIASGCGKAGSRTGNGSSGFGIGTGLTDDESILIEECTAVGNKKYGFFFEHQCRFNSSNAVCQAVSASGFIVRNCTARDNLYDFGGVRANDVTYENCRSLSLQDTSLLSMHKGYDFRNHSVRTTLTGCSIEESFADVADSSAEYYTPVLWAYNAGIADKTVTGDTVLFGPDENLTRALAAEYLYRYAGRPGDVVTLTDTAAINELPRSYTDVSSISSAYDAAEWLTKNGLADIFTTSEQFGPNEYCTKGQYLELLYRYAGSPEVTSGSGSGGDSGDESDSGNIELPEVPVSTTGSSGNSVSGNSVSGNSVSDNSVSDDSGTDSTGSGSSVSDNDPEEADIPDDSNAPVYVRWAAEKNIITEAAGSFDTEAYASRSDAAVWLYRYNSLEG